MPTKRSSKTKKIKSIDIVDFYGDDVFSIKTMQDYMAPNTYKSLVSTICKGKSLNAGIADEVADAMKVWALEKGATHFTHWFQPLTGSTAEKHDSFVTPDGNGGAIYKFSGKELIQGEPDASSFPSGGLRATFEARGYTGWDPTSPAFIRQGDNGATLCIPTVFCGYHGEALDKKTPLLRSINALSEQFCRMAKLFGVKVNGKQASASLGAEQEYFLIDRDVYEMRPDLFETGRTLFGRIPAKHQQMDDHYFGAIKSRVVSFMCELDDEMWRLGVPAKTRHNEVCPGQFELAPMYEELNLAVDHNMLMMEVIEEVAERHGFACLLHEKPFAGVNGSGKHNNWNVNGPDGKNWFKPGDNPHENARFLTVICAVIKAVDTHAGLLRSTVATAGNDHRLGANEAPPAIISIFLGEQLHDVIRQVEKGGAKSSKGGGSIEIGVSSLPSLPRDATDRNRTSPFAFTGNKFEFRAVGSSQNCAGANIVLNTIVAEAIDEICIDVEKLMKQKVKFNDALQKVLQSIVKKHKRVLFEGDNYAAEWHKEAAKRGLPNLRTTDSALKEITTQKTIKLFEKYKVLSKRELEARYEIYHEIYEETISIEAQCAVDMAKTMIAPAALEYQGDLAQILNEVKAAGIKNVVESRKLLSIVVSETESLLKAVHKLEDYIRKGKTSDKLKGMLALRKSADHLEELLPEELWPLPSYSEMMFMI